MCDEPSDDGGDDTGDDTGDDDGDDGYGDDTGDDDGDDGYGDDSDNDQDSGVDDEPDQFNSLHLAVHNKYRSAHGVPALAYDAELAAAAQKWSEYMAVTGEFKHSKCSPDDPTRCDSGENLAWHSNEDTAATEWATVAWYDELYDPGYDFSNPGFDFGTGHFT